MALPEYRSQRNFTWQNISMSLAAFAQKLSPYLSSGAGGTYQNIGNSSTSSNIDWSQATVQELNLNNNPTLTFSNGVEGASLSLLLKNGLTPRTVTWPSNVTWSRGEKPSIASLTPSGSIDPYFLSGTGFQSFGSPNSNVRACFTLSTGKILVWNNNGMGGTYNGTSVSVGLLRFNADGTYDPSFGETNAWGSGMNGYCSVLELPDGRILVGGDFSGGMGGQNPTLRLLSADGVADPSFTPSVSGMSPNVTSIVRQSNGKIVIAGFFTSVNGVTHYSLARFNSDLTLDSSFTAGISDSTGMSARQLYTLAVDSADSIFVGGQFYPTDMGTGGSAGIAKLDSAGNAVSFAVGTGFDGGGGGANIYKISITASGKLIVGGNFFSYGGTSVNNIIRLLSDGSIDSSFVTGSGANGVVNTLQILPGNKVVVIGNMISAYNGTTVGRLFILNDAGAIDTTIVIPSSGINSGMGSGLYGITIQSNGNILITGPFTTYGGATANAIVSIAVTTATAVYSTIDFKYNGVEYIGSF